MNIQEQALQVAITQIGQEEKPRGSNWGHPVQDYLMSVGINFAASWCMAFLYWCFEHAASQTSQKNPMFKTGGVLAQWNNSLAHRVTVNVPADIHPGDIFIMDFGHGLGHTGIIELVEANGTLHTIEGNTNDTGSREGYEVCRRQRRWNNKMMKGFLRFGFEKNRRPSLQREFLDRRSCFAG